MCEALEQITPGIYDHTQLPLTGRPEEAPIVLTHNAIMIKVIKLEQCAPVLCWQHTSTTFTYKSSGEHFKVCVSVKLGVHFHQYL